mmetsp:Transcript_4704/g.6050  ORF Transcript_4704/g.6050 Transcript_4704/m.6050 type:complete len:484 (+) Transcript_4704:64-1515(+)
MIVPSDSKLPQIVEHKKKKKKEGLSYYEQVEAQKLAYRNARMPRRIPTPRPPTPPEIEEEIVVKPKGRKQQTHSLSDATNRSIQALCLTNKQVRKLQKKFDSLGAGGEVTKLAFWQELEITPSPFTDKLFEMIDTDGSGIMDFSEFMSILITYCIFNQEDILRFAFSCFDSDGSGYIDSQEVTRLIDMVNSQDPKFMGTIKAAEKKITADEDGRITFPEFKQLNRDFPLLLQPAFALQDHMHKHTLGDKDWIRVMENMTHAQQKVDLEEKQFGKPVSGKQWKKHVGSFGLSRKFPNIDIHYINSMRPSKVAVMPPSLDDIDDLGDDYEITSTDGSIDSQGSLAKRMSIKQSVKELSMRKSVITMSGPQAAYALEQARKIAKEKQENLAKEEKKKAKARGGFLNSLNYLPKLGAPPPKNKRNEIEEQMKKDKIENSQLKTANKKAIVSKSSSDDDNEDKNDDDVLKLKNEPDTSTEVVPFDMKF